MKTWEVVKTTRKTLNPDVVQISICNGIGKVNKGYRQVAFDANGNVRPVQTAQWSGMPSDRHTKQIARNGDFVLRFEWFPAVWKLLQYKGGFGLEEVSLKDNAALLAKLPKELDAWLGVTPDKYTESFLPAGVGWDGVLTVSSKEKVSKIRELFSEVSGVETAEGNWLDNLVRNALVSPFSAMDLKPTEPLPPTLKMETKWCEHTIEWLLWREGKPVEFYTGRDWSDEEYDQGAPMPDDVIKAIRIEWCNDELGVSWRYYK